MKPSERIKEISIKNFSKVPMSLDRLREFKLQSIIIYLDEEWEKNQPCKHEKIQETHWGEGMKVCVDCKILILR